MDIFKFISFDENYRMLGVGTHFKHKTVMWVELCNGNSYTNKTPSLYRFPTHLPTHPHNHTTHPHNHTTHPHHHTTPPPTPPHHHHHHPLSKLMLTRKQQPPLWPNAVSRYYELTIIKASRRNWRIETSHSNCLEPQYCKTNRV